MVPQPSPAELVHTTEPFQSCVHKLASFPQLVDSEFDEACSALLSRFELHGHRQNEWTAADSFSQNGLSCLSITKPLLLHSGVPDASDGTGETELDEDDDEVAQTSTTAPRAVIRYDVVLSPSYRVPVLYFNISDTRHRYPPTMETLYSHVIPQAFKAQAEHGGVIGGITVTDHPATNKPVFFIHPCRTAEVMEASVSERDVTTYDYLLIWMGALGKCVGLNVPLSLVDPDLQTD